MMDDGALQLHEDIVRPEWIDYNGHMNVAYYVLAFDFATDAFLDHVGLDHNYKNEANCTTFVVDMNVCYLGEVLEGDRLRFTTQILNSDEKRLHYFHRMYHAEKGYLAATNELMTVHISLESRRVASMPEALLKRITAIRNEHAALPLPEQAGRIIAIRSKSAAS
ncbi:MAG: thioesterase-like protein [Alphaproteobacteria bacterium]|nr:thioesterase-like protein [Alphaproteobacteria bacterium]